MEPAWKMKIILASYVFDAYREGKVEGGAYSELAEKSLEAEQGIFQLLMKIAVYASGIALLVVAAMLVYHSRHKEKRGEAKSDLLRVFGVILIIFALVTIIDFVVSIAI